MGSIFSRSQATPTLTDEPWRETVGWGPCVRNKLKDDILQLDQCEDLVPFMNIVLTGQTGAGKSSYFNSLNNIFQEKVIGAAAQVGVKSTSLTKKYRVYKITVTHENSSNTLLWTICDTIGMEKSMDYDVRNILKAIDGHLLDGFEFSEEEIQEGGTLYEPNPELKDKAHCVAVVVNGKDLINMIDAMKEKLKFLRNELINRDIPTYILLTHIDEACDEVAKDVKNVYRSVAIRDLVHKVGRMLHGLPDNQIFPVVNYKKDVELKDDMDILLLTALRQILRNAKENIHRNIPSTNYPRDITSESDLHFSVMESMPPSCN